MKQKILGILKRLISILLIPFAMIGTIVIWLGKKIVFLVKGQTHYGRVTRQFLVILGVSLIGLAYISPGVINQPIRGLNAIIQEDLGGLEQLDQLPGGVEITPILQSIAIPEIPESSFILGLDLQGGVRIVYDVDVENVSNVNIDAALDSLRQVVGMRVNTFGVSEPRIFIEEGDTTRLVVELAGIDNPEQAVEQIGQTPLLQFFKGRPAIDQERILNSNQEFFDQLQSGELDLSTMDEEDIPLENPFYEEEDLILEGSDVSRASVVFDPTTGAPQVSVIFDSEGRRTFAEFTRDNLGEQLFIVLDGEVISGPTINEEIPTGQALISGQFSIEESRTLVDSLNAGALPLPIIIASLQTVEASLGVSALEQSIQAAILGLALVAVYMLLMYRGFGFVALIALILYSIFVMTLIKLLGFTLTLAGITGFIVSIGLAVDGNILIFERIKEELKNQHTFEYSVKEGFRRAWISIRDSQVSTFISALILFYLASGIVQGFAVSLALGVIVSMFTAVTVTRMIIILLVTQNWLMKHRLGNWLLFMNDTNR